MESICCKPASRAGPTPATAGAPKRTTYRRSTTTKAPRKRTFIMFMEKYSEMRNEGAGGLLCKANSMACAEIVSLCCDGGDGGMMGGNGNIRTFNGDSGSWDAFQGPLPRAVVLGAAALLAALVLLPSQAFASSGSFRNVAAMPTTPRSPRVMCLNPVAPPPATPVQDAIVYGHVQLSAAERKLLKAQSQQLFFRETLRSEAIRI